MRPSLPEDTTKDAEDGAGEAGRPCVVAAELKDVQGCVELKAARLRESMDAKF